MRSSTSVVMCLVLASFAARADTFTSNLLSNPGAETGSTAGWTLDGNSNPGVDRGSFDPGILPHSGNFDFYGHNGSLGTLSQTVSLLSQGITAAQINAGQVTADLSFWEQGLNQGSPSDSGDVVLVFYSATGDVLGTIASGEVDAHNGNWAQFTSADAVPAGAISAMYRIEFIRHQGSDNDAFVDDNSLVLDVASGTPAPSVTPEPSSVLLLGTGLLGIAGSVRRKAARG